VEEFKASVSLNVADLRRLVAKNALGTGAMVVGDSFLTSPLAVCLRQVLDVRSDWQEPEGLSGEKQMHQGGDWPITRDESELFLRQLGMALRPALYRATNSALAAPFIELPGARTLFLATSQPTECAVKFIVLGICLPALVAPTPMPVPGPFIVRHRMIR
jgi:hypothetical protein